LFRSEGRLGLIYPLVDLVDTAAGLVESLSQGRHTRIRGGRFLYTRQRSELLVGNGAQPCRVLAEALRDLRQPRVVRTRVVVAGEPRDPAVEVSHERIRRVGGRAVAALPQVAEQGVLLVRRAFFLVGGLGLAGLFLGMARGALRLLRLFKLGQVGGILFQASLDLVLVRLEHIV